MISLVCAPRLELRSEAAFHEYIYILHICDISLYICKHFIVYSADLSYSSSSSSIRLCIPSYVAFYTEHARTTPNVNNEAPFVYTV